VVEWHPGGECGAAAVDGYPVRPADAPGGCDCASGPVFTGGLSRQPRGLRGAEQSGLTLADQ
jgi:hypothetical protein